MRILIVEDDPATAEIIPERLKLGGIPVDDLHFAQSAHEAANAVIVNPPDVILWDLRLKDSTAESSMDGLPAYTEKFPVIVLTGYDDPKWWKRCVQRLGAMDYLQKVPFLNKGNEGMFAHVILTSLWRHHAKL